MSIMMFDPKAQSYLPADQLFLNAGIKQLDVINASHKVLDEYEEHPGENPPPFTQQTLKQSFNQDSGQSRPIEPALLAEQIMVSPVITLRSETSVADAQTLFRQHQFRHIPILSAESRLIGIISDRDLLQHIDNPFQTNIQRLVNGRVLVAKPDTEIREIAAVLFEQRIGAMPIIDDDENLIGILTRSDILRILVNRAPLELWV